MKENGKSLIYGYQFIQKFNLCDLELYINNPIPDSPICVTHHINTPHIPHMALIRGGVTLLSSWT